MSTAYNIYLNLVNETIDDREISTTDLYVLLGVSRDKLLSIRNSDVEDEKTLYKIMDYLYPDKADFEAAYINEAKKHCTLAQLRALYRNKDALLEELENINIHKYNATMRDILRSIVVKNSRNLLREETKNEKTHTLCKNI